MTRAVPISTVVFDIDGTLIDSNDAHTQAYAESLRMHGRPAETPHVRRVIGMGADKVLPELAGVSAESELGRAITRRKKDIFTALLPSLRATRGARDLVKYLRDEGVGLVVATSGDDEEATALLEQAGVADLFSKRTSKDDAASSKPDPDIVRAALMKAHARPEASVMIGDTPYDIQAAAQANIAIVALRCGGFWPDAALRAAADIFDDPAALLAAWRVRSPFPPRRVASIRHTSVDD